VKALFKKRTNRIRRAGTLFYSNKTTFLRGIEKKKEKRRGEKNGINLRRSPGLSKPDNSWPHQQKKRTQREQYPRSALSSVG